MALDVAPGDAVADPLEGKPHHQPIVEAVGIVLANGAGDPLPGKAVPGSGDEPWVRRLPDNGANEGNRVDRAATGHPPGPSVLVRQHDRQDPAGDGRVGRCGRVPCHREVVGVDLPDDSVPCRLDHGAVVLAIGVIAGVEAVEGPDGGEDRRDLLLRECCDPSGDEDPAALPRDPKPVVEVGDRVGWQAITCAGSDMTKRSMARES